MGSAKVPADFLIRLRHVEGTPTEITRKAVLPPLFDMARMISHAQGSEGGEPNIFFLPGQRLLETPARPGRSDKIPSAFVAGRAFPGGALLPLIEGMTRKYGRPCGVTP